MRSQHGLRLVHCLVLVLLAIGPCVAVALTPAALLTRETKLKASDAAAHDWFGNSVAVSGDTMVVGSPQDDDPGTDSGSAYVFVQTNGVWSQQQKLTASDRATYALFGYSVAVSGDTILVGAVGATSSGAAYVFVRSGSVWTQQQKLTASDAAGGDWFGNSVAISGDTAVVGSPDDDGVGLDSGSAYVFLRSNGVWSQQQKLAASDAAAYDEFGNSVAVSGNTILVGSHFDSDAGSLSGSAFVFERSGGVWNEQQKLTASDAAAHDEFGRSVALDADTALVGSPGDGDAGTLSGAAYSFVRSGGVWSQQQKLTASDATAFVLFGQSVAVNAGTVMVGAAGDSTAGTSSGSAYVFARSGDVWSQQQKLTASDAAAVDLFGESVAVSGNTTVVGARFDEDEEASTNSGSVYVYEPEPCTPPPTATAAGTAAICPGSSTPLTGSGSIGCSWTPADGLSDANSCSPIATPSSTTTYTLAVTDGNGCSSTNNPTVTVTVNPQPVATISPEGPTTFCGVGILLVANAGSSYLWSNGRTTRIIGVSASGSYWVRVTDANGCSAISETITITVKPRPTAAATGTATIVAGSSTPLSGSGGVSCSWSPVAGLSSASSCSPTASPSATTTYTLTVTGANGCASTNNPTVTVTVVAPTTTTLSSFPNPSDVGRSVTFSAWVSSLGSPTGTVTFKDGTTTLQVVNLTSPSAIYAISALPAGDHSITATYSGDATLAGSDSPVLTQTVRRLAPIFGLVSSTPSQFGQDVTITVSVSSLSSIVPTGTVTLRDGVANVWQLFGNGSLDSSGHVTLMLPAPSVGSHPLTIFYSGDANHNSATSRVFKHRVINLNACGGLQGPLASSPATPTDPQGVAAADFNGDSAPDVATANFGSNTVSVFFGNRDGSFQPRFDYPVGIHPIAVALADFNNDGPVDIAVANAGSGTVSVLLSDQGPFGPAQSYAAGSSPQSVAVADLNGDGRLDLIVSNQGSANISVFLGNGDGTFQAAVNSPAGTRPSGVVVGNFNGDSIPDVAVGNFDTAQVSVLLGNGDGTFQAPVAYAVGLNPISVAAADFDGNGAPDLAVANFGASYVSVLLGNGDGTFKARVNYGVGSKPVSVAAADFNGDGAADLVTANSNSNNVSVLLGNGNGTFQANTLYAVGTRPHAIAVADFEGNGKPDVVVANEISNNLSVLSGSCPTTTTVTAMFNPTLLGRQAVFNIRVTSSRGSTLPTGTVTVKDGSTVLGTATLVSGYASFTTSALCAGNHGITAVYGSDSEFTPSTSPGFNHIVQTPTITAPVSFCPGSPANASVPSAGPGAIYTWTITNGSIFMGAGTEEIIWAAAGASPVTIKVTVKTASGCTATASKGVTTAAPSAVISAPVQVCAVQAGYSASVTSAGAGAMYFWSIVGGTITSGSNTTSIKFTPGSSSPVTLAVTVINAAGCSTSGLKTVTVNPIPDDTITAPAEVCPNSTGNTASVPDAGPGARYVWTITNGTVTAGAGTRNVTFTAKASGSVGIKITVTTSSGCSTTGATAAVIKTSC